MNEELSLTELEQALGSKERVLFFVTWLKHDMNATKAYKELHPNSTDHSCRVGGSRMLANIDTKVIMNAFGLDHELYFRQLRDGVTAEKWNDFTGEREADHRTRREYHKALGKLLNVETDSTSNIQIAGKEMSINFVD